MIRCRVWYCFDVSHKLDNLKSIPFPCCEHSSTSWRPWYSAILINETSFALTYFRVFDDEKINNSYMLQNETSKSMKYLKYFYWVSYKNILLILRFLCYYQIQNMTNIFIWIYKFDTVTENIELGSWKDYISSTECRKQKCRQHKVAISSEGKIC